MSGEEPRDVCVVHIRSGDDRVAAFVIDGRIYSSCNELDRVKREAFP